MVQVNREKLVQQNNWIYAIINKDTKTAENKHLEVILKGAESVLKKKHA